MIHFFATFSHASRKQIQQIKTLADSFAGKPLVIIGITVEEDTEKLREFVAKHDIPYRILLSGKGVLKQYKLGQVPNLCSINRGGVVTAMQIGFNPHRTIDAEIEKLVGTPWKEELREQYRIKK